MTFFFDRVKIGIYTHPFLPYATANLATQENFANKKSTNVNHTPATHPNVYSLNTTYASTKSTVSLAAVITLGTEPFAILKSINVVPIHAITMQLVMI